MSSTLLAMKEIIEQSGIMKSQSMKKENQLDHADQNGKQIREVTENKSCQCQSFSETTVYCNALQKDTSTDKQPDQELNGWQVDPEDFI